MRDPSEDDVDATATSPEEPREPWDLPQSSADADIQEARSATTIRGEDRSVRGASAQSDDPWAMVADEVLKRDEVPKATARRVIKRRAREDHQHEYEETRLPGGLVRRVCACGEVVIRSID